MTNQELSQIYSAYLPYGVKYMRNGKLSNREIEGISIDNWTNALKKDYDIKLVLRPLSDLTKEIEHNGEKFYPIGKLHNSSYRRNGKTCKGEYEVNEVSRQVFTTKKSSFSRGVEVDLNRIDNNEYWVIKYLLKWHFDVFGLIEKGLAINLNEVK